MTLTDPGVASITWREQAVIVGNRTWAYREAGVGEAVLVLDPPGTSGGVGPLEQLAGSRRLISIQFGGPNEDLVGRRGVSVLRLLIEALEIEHPTLIARGSIAEVVLRLAIDDPALVRMLVLESPPLLAADELGDGSPDAELLEAMSSLEVPTLVLAGTRTEAGSSGDISVYKRLPASTVALIYDAAEDVRTERASAYMAAVSEYLDRGQAFVVSDKSTVLHA